MRNSIGFEVCWYCWYAGEADERIVLRECLGGSFKLGVDMYRDIHD
jgi:hypothetical protein